MQTKDNLKHISKFASIFALLMIFISFTQCVEELEVEQVEYNIQMPDDENHGGGGDSGGGSGGTGIVGINQGISDDFNETGATEVAKTSTNLGVKDFEQIYKTMMVLTGVNPYDGAGNTQPIRDIYAELSAQMPTDNDVKLFNSSAQFAIFKLGSVYCDVMLDDSKYYNSIFTSLNIAQAPNQILNNEIGKTALVNDLMNQFWGVGVQDESIVTQTRADLVALVTDLLEGESMSNGGNSRKVAKGVCASLIVTPPVIMF